MGRTFDPPLDGAGERQAAALGRHLRMHRGLLIRASPRLRAQQTAQAIARATGADVATADELDEVDYGCWSGQTFAVLSADPAWDRWNRKRARAQTPAGDSMQRVQQRILQYIRETVRSFPNRTLALVTHAEAVRAALLHYLGLELDDYLRLSISPGSCSSLLFESGSIAIRVNERPCEQGGNA